MSNIGWWGRRSCASVGSKFGGRLRVGMLRLSRMCKADRSQMRSAQPIISAILKPAFISWSSGIARIWEGLVFAYVS